MANGERRPAELDVIRQVSAVMATRSAYHSSCADVLRMAAVSRTIDAGKGRRAFRGGLGGPSIAT